LISREKGIDNTVFDTNLLVEAGAREEEGGRYTGGERTGGGRYTGGVRTGGGKRGFQDDGKREKLRKITQHWSNFGNRKKGKEARANKNRAGTEI